MSQRIFEETAKDVADLFTIVAADLHRFALRVGQGDAAAADDLVQGTSHDAARF
ncbi:hypothetical protein AB0425_31125 [Actinosynnema sp. NPDC051121]